MNIRGYVISLLIILHAPAALGHNGNPVQARHEFVENKGQWLKPAIFQLRQNNLLFAIENNAFHYVFYNPEDLSKLSSYSHSQPQKKREKAMLRGHVLRMEFSGALPFAKASGMEPFSHYYNYFLGKDKETWKTGVKPYKSVIIENLYEGVNLIVYGNPNGSIKYDLHIKPGISPEKIKLLYRGGLGIKLVSGALQIKTSVNTLTELKPYAYQKINGKVVGVECFYRLNEDNSVQFSIGNYDAGRELIIDPELVFSTYSGSTADNFGAAATYDQEGNLYTAGITDGNFGSYPVSPGAFQQFFGGGPGSWPQRSFPCDITISKYNNDGTQLMYATYLGGSDQDYAHSLVTDKQNRLIVFGTSLSRDFPVTATAFDTSHNDSFDIVLTKFDTSGTFLIGSTFVGGSHSDGLSLPDTLCMNYMDQMRGEVQVDANGDIIVGTVTSSVNFPVSVSAFQKQKKGAQDGCVFKMDSSLKTMRWCTYLGDTLNETLNSIEIMPNGTVFAVGGTHSRHIPVSPGVYSGAYHGGISDGYIARISPNGSTLERFMYWGGPGYDQCYFIKSNQAGDIFVLGQNMDTIPVTNGVHANTGGTIFVSSFNNNLNTLLFSTRIGSGMANNALSPSAFMVDVCGNIYASVWGGPTNRSNSSGAFRLGFPSNTFNMPITPDALIDTTDNEDFYLFVLTPGADTLLYATYFGEYGSGDHVDGGTSRFDKRGIVYQSVCASCSTGPTGIFPTTPTSYSPKNNSPRCSNVGFKLDFRKNNTIVADFIINPRNSCGDSLITFTSKSFNGKHYRWFLEGVLRSTDTSYVDTIRAQGSYKMKLIVIDSSRCIIVDSITKTFERRASSNADFEWKRDSCSAKVIFKNKSTTQNPTPVPILWQFGDGDTSTATHPEHVFPSTDTGTYTVKLIVNVGSPCADTTEQQVFYDNDIHLLKANFTPTDTMRCEPTLLELRYKGINGTQFDWFLNDTLFTHAKDTDIILALFGAYKLKLVVTDTSVLCNKKDSIERTIHVFPEVYPNFTHNRDSCSFTVTFTNTTLIVPGGTENYKWYFGDGDSSYLKSPVHSYPYGGTFSVRLVANQGLDCEHVMPQNIKLDTLPSVLQANFTINPSPGCLPVTVTFNNTSINGIKRWWYKNGVFIDSTNNTWTDTFNSKQTVLVKIIISDTLTCKPYDTIEKQLQILPSGISDFDVVRDTCSQAVLLINKSVSNNSADTLSYLWDFGDGTTAISRDPVHVYPTNGDYTIRLIVFPGTPCADTSEQKITYDSIAHVLDASFTINDSTFCLPGIIKTNNTSTNPKKRKWFLNGAFVTDSLNFTDTISIKGTYELMLIVTDSATCLKADTLIRKFVIEDNADANFDITRDSCSLDVVFINKSTVYGSGPGKFIWYFGDGDSTDIKDPTHTYSSSDYYTIKLVSNPGTICADSIEKTYYIDGDSSLEVKIPNVFTPNNDGMNDCYYISGLTKCDDLKIKIYNRWGQLQFETTDYKTCWNGQNLLGYDVTEGVYFYILQIRKKDDGLIEQHGTITLIRR